MSNTESNTSHGLVNIGEEIARPVAFQFDPAKYHTELDDFDLTEEQKQELLAVLWSIMCSFVELGFSVDVCTALLGDASPIPEGDELR